MNKISKATIIRTILLLLAIINQILVIFDVSPIPINNGQLELLLSTIITAGCSIVSWWKNNSFTQEAISADKVMMDLKNNK